MARTVAVFASSNPPRDNGVAPSRLSTPYRRSNPVAMPSDTIAAAITESDSTPGTRKSTGSAKLVVIVSTFAKNTRMPRGIASVTIMFSPRRSCSMVSARACANNARRVTSVPRR